MLVPYRTALAAALDGKIGTTTLPFDRGGNIERRQEMPIGDLVADGMRLTYGVDFGYITGGSLRTQFPACSYGAGRHDAPSLELTTPATNPSTRRSSRAPAATRRAGRTTS